MSKLAPQLHHLAVARTARYYTLGPDPSEVRHLWIALHGYAMLASRFIRLLAPLTEDGQTLVVAPEALSRFYLETGRDGQHGEAIGATWLTREDRQNELSDAIRYLDQLHGEWSSRVAAGASVGVLGFSQGAAMAARWIGTGATLPEQVVIWGIEPPADAMPALAERMQGREVTMIAGDRDRFAPAGGIEAQAAALARLGVRARAERFSGGHSLPAEAVRRLGAVGGTA